MSALIDLSGQRFGRLVVEYRLPPQKGKQTRWLCRCDCGSEHSVCGPMLKDGRARSCGCLRSELSAQRARVANYPARYWAAHPELKLQADVRAETARRDRKCYYAANRAEYIKRAMDWKRSTGYVKRTVDELADTYVRSAVRNQTGIRTVEIPDELIELKRQQLRLRRAIKTARQLLKESE